MAEDGEQGTAPVQGTLGRIFGSFNRTFWLVNTFELFERGAYYGMMAVLGVHVVETLLAGDPHAAAVWGSLYSFLIILLYFLPLAAAALAEKYGFRTMLTVAFSSMLVGYFMLSTVRPGQFGMLVISFVLVGIGAGIFKPIISATIAHVTPSERRNLAYSIYYWMINLGATIMPFLIWVAFNDAALYHYAFVLSGGLVIVNTVLLLLYYRDPVPARKELSVLAAVMRIGPALKDRKFVVLLGIYAGFWFMFAYNHTFLPVYMVQFGRMPSWVGPALIATVNPATIITLGPFLGKAVEKFKSLNVMMTGILLFCAGLMINGLSSTPFLFALGIFVFSIGEFITHPGFISYVSKIAPKDKVTLYMAAIFVSTGMGQILGGFTHGLWYDHYARELMRPKVYIALVTAVGLVTLLAFILYNRWIIADAKRSDPAYREAPSVWTKPITFVFVMLLIPLSISGGFAVGTSQLVDDDGGGGGVDWTQYASTSLGLPDITGATQEGETSDELVDIDVPNVAKVVFRLTWTDEADAGIRYTNQPDSFRLTVTPPNGTAMSARPTPNTQGGSGSVSVTFDIPLPDKEPFFNVTGQWLVEVECTAAGDQVPLVNIGGFRVQADTGNAWTLTIECTYMQKGG